MSLSNEEVLVKLGEHRRLMAETARKGHGDINDAVDVFIYWVAEWLDVVCEFVEPDIEQWANRNTGHKVAAVTLARDMPVILFEISDCLKAGLIRPAIHSWRKLKEVHVDSLYMQSDPTGEVAWRWLHWGIQALLELDPTNNTLQEEAKRARELFQAQDDRYGKIGTWAKMPSGKKHHSFAARNRYVQEWQRKRYARRPERLKMIARVQIGEDGLLKIANAQVHPTIGANQNLIWVPELLYTSVTYALDILASVKLACLPDDDLPPDATPGQILPTYPEQFSHLEPVWHTVFDSYQGLERLVAKKLQDSPANPSP